MSQSAPAGAPAPQAPTPDPGEADLVSLPIAAVDTLLALSDAAARATRPDDVVEQIVASAARLVGLPWAVLMLRDPDTEDLRLVAAHGIPLAAFPPVLRTPRPSHVNPALFGGHLLILEDYGGGPPLSPVWWEPAARMGLRTVLAVPLLAGDAAVGSLHVAGPQPHQYAPVEVALLRRLARLAAQMLVQTRALSATARRAGALETMQAVARTLDASLDLEGVLDMLVERAAELSGATGSVLMLWDEAAGHLAMRKLFHAAELAGMRVQPNESVTGRAFVTGRPQWENSYQQFEGAIPRARAERITNVLAVPLLRQEHAFGTITVFSKLFKPFTAEDAELLTLFASQAAVALDNQVLFTRVARQERQLDSIIQALQDGLVVYDREGRVLLFNRAAEEMLGLTPRIVGADRTAIAADRESFVAHPVEFLHDRAYTFRTVLERGVTLAGMARIGRDPPRTVEAFYSPYRDETGAVAGVIALCRDVSTTQELERLRGELEVAHQQEDFLSVASHELRTPITAIKGFADLLVRRLMVGAAVTSRDVAMLASISAQVGRLTGLVNDLLDVGHLHSGQIEFRWSQPGIATVLRSAVDSVRPLAGPREGDLAIQGPDICVRGDGDRLEQVFVNLLTNALKYSAAGPITISISPADDQVCVAVQDGGKGIAPEDLPHVFERFFRAHAVYAHQRGIGLGLYISREIVERHGGRIWAESTPGQGSTFYVELPALPCP